MQAHGSAERQEHNRSDQTASTASALVRLQNTQGGIDNTNMRQDILLNLSWEILESKRAHRRGGSLVANGLRSHDERAGAAWQLGWLTTNERRDSSKLIEGQMDRRGRQYREANDALSG